jgi:hypothetical protein
LTILKQSKKTLAILHYHFVTFVPKYGLLQDLERKMAMIKSLQDYDLYTPILRFPAMPLYRRQLKAMKSKRANLSLYKMGQGE